MYRFARFICFLFVFALLFCLCLAGLALAVDTLPAHDAVPAIPTAPAALAVFLQQTISPLLTALLMGFIAKFLNSLGAKYKIDTLLQKDNFLEKLAFQGITLAEERAAQYAGSKLALTGSQKLDIAVSHILSAMPKVPDSQARSVVQALLAQTPGVGATGDTAISRDSLAGILGSSTPLNPIEVPLPAAP